MDYMTAAEAARLWGVSARSVRNYCAAGRVPGAKRVGKTWAIPADAPKPARANAIQTPPANLLLKRLRDEKECRLPGGIYHRVQVELTYNSNHIEGSTLTRDQTRYIFETASFLPEGNVAIRVDDVIETSNHFRCIDYVIDHANDPLTEGMIKELHRILKTATADSRKDWFAVGEYKRLPNEVGGRATASPESVASKMAVLLDKYEGEKNHVIDDIIAFHVGFERIHPFQDGNGRVGRLIMFKECLRHGVVPFVIEDDMKLFYYRGLAQWDKERGYLTDTCLAAQDRFREVLAYFGIEDGMTAAQEAGTTATQGDAM